MLGRGWRLRHGLYKKACTHARTHRRAACAAAAAAAAAPPLRARCISIPSTPKPSSTSYHLHHSDKIATECLKATGWSVEAAIEHFYASGLQGAVPAVDMRAIEQLFERYKGALHII